MSAKIDPITRSVVQHRLSSIVKEMGEAMLRTSYSQILNSSRDFSLAICDTRGRLIAQADHIPVHVGALPWATLAVEERFKDVQPGDVILLNDPYYGGSHLPDLTAFVPVFDGGKRLLWTIVRAHQSDIGGATHGAYNPAATEIFQEGLRIPPIKLYEAGKLRDDLLDLLALNIRNPRDFRGDLAAMLGAAHLGERRVSKLFAEFGADDRRGRDRGNSRHHRAADPRHGLDLERRRVSRRGVPRRRRPWPHRHPDRGKGHQAGQRYRGGLVLLRSAVDQFREFLARQHAGRGGDGLCLSDRRRYPQKHRRAAAAEGHCKAGYHGLGRSAGR